MTDNKQYIGKSVNAIVIRDGKVLLAWAAATLSCNT